MVLQNSGTPIKFSQIQAEFGGTNPISISEYYNNGSANYVGNISGIPTSGNPITISAFYGKLALPIIKVNGANVSLISTSINMYYYKFISPSNTNTITFNNTTLCSILLVGGGGSGGRLGGGGGGGGYVRELNYTFNPGIYTITVGSGGAVGPSYPGDGLNGGISSISSNNITIFSAEGGTGGKTSSKGGNSGNIDINNINTSYIGGNGYVNSYYSTFLGGGGAGASTNGSNATTTSPGLSSIAYTVYNTYINRYAVDFVSIGGSGGDSRANTTLHYQNTLIGCGGNGGNSLSISPNRGYDGCVVITMFISNFTTMTFTPAGATGNTGPTLTNLKNNYTTNYPSYQSWINDTDYFKSDNGKQIWTIQKSGTYKITVAGAGTVSKNVDEFGNYYYNKGYGHYITTNLIIGNKLTLIVGQKGINGNGGGGSFVFNGLDMTNLLICAGGAGGSVDFVSGAGIYGSNKGKNGAINATTGISGNSFMFTSGGAGGNVNMDGSDGNYTITNFTFIAYGGKGGKSGKSWTNAGLFDSSIGSFGGGGLAGSESPNYYDGKNGGGGGGGYDGGGGGGGGTGGSSLTSGKMGGGGGGGGSYPTSNTIQVNTTDGADGYITIELL